MGEAGARDQLVGGRQVAQERRLEKPLSGGQCLDASAGQAAHRHHDVGMGLIRLIEHAFAADAASPAHKSSTRQRKRLVHFMLHCEIIVAQGGHAWITRPCRGLRGASRRTT